MQLHVNPRSPEEEEVQTFEARPDNFLACFCVVLLCQIDGYLITCRTGTDLLTLHVLCMFKSSSLPHATMTTIHLLYDVTSLKLLLSHNTELHDSHHCAFGGKKRMKEMTTACQLLEAYGNTQELTCVPSGVLEQSDVKRMAPSEAALLASPGSPRLPSLP